MKKNMGPIDQAVRFVIGAVIIIIGYYYNSWWGLLGLLPLATAVFAFCPGYLPFGISTCKNCDDKGKGKSKAKGKGK